MSKHNWTPVSCYVLDFVRYLPQHYWFSVVVWLIMHIRTKALNFHSILLQPTFSYPILMKHNLTPLSLFSIGKKLCFDTLSDICYLSFKKTHYFLFINTRNTIQILKYCLQVKKAMILKNNQQNITWHQQWRQVCFVIKTVEKI